jgi:hypothetical protein
LVNRQYQATTACVQITKQPQPVSRARCRLLGGVCSHNLLQLGAPAHVLPALSALLGLSIQHHFFHVYVLLPLSRSLTAVGSTAVLSC